jgi:hypothetical protein
MYHWFFLIEITVVKKINNLNVCSVHSYLYPQFRFNAWPLLSKRNEIYSLSHKVFFTYRFVVILVLNCWQTGLNSGSIKGTLFFYSIFSSPCQRECELLPSLGIHRLSSVNFSHFNLLLWNPSAKWTKTW